MRTALLVLWVGVGAGCTSQIAPTDEVTTCEAGKCDAADEIAITIGETLTFAEGGTYRVGFDLADARDATLGITLPEGGTGTLRLFIDGQLRKEVTELERYVAAFDRTTLQRVWGGRPGPTWVHHTAELVVDRGATVRLRCESDRCQGTFTTQSRLDELLSEDLRADIAEMVHQGHDPYPAIEEGRSQVTLERLAVHRVDRNPETAPPRLITIASRDADGLGADEYMQARRGELPPPAFWSTDASWVEHTPAVSLLSDPDAAAALVARAMEEAGLAPDAPRITSVAFYSTSYGCGGLEQEVSDPARCVDLAHVRRHDVIYDGGDYAVIVETAELTLERMPRDLSFFHF